MSPRGFDRIMIDLEAGGNAKLGRLTDAEFRCLVTGVWPLAAKARQRGYLTVGDVPAEPQDVARQARCSVATARKTLTKMRQLGMLDYEAESGLEKCHDWDEIQPAPRTDKNGARRQALFRDPELRKLIRERDQDLCRYCGIEVHWNDRRGPHGGTYDHIDPDGPNADWNLVVACRACNAQKCDKTAEERGMELRPEPKSDLDPKQNGARKTKRVSTPEEEVEEKTPLTPRDRGEAGEGQRVVRFRQRPVAADRLAFAEAILAEFNQQAGTGYGAYTAEGKPSEDLKRILGALADATPPLEELDEAKRIIARRLAEPFWQGRPHTGVVFGPNVFAANRENAKGDGTRRSDTAALAAVNWEGS